MPDLTGKTAIVTGANSGIGFETARALAAKGAQVVLACRSLERGGEALERIRQERPGADARVMQLDLAELESVRQFAQAFAGRYHRLHILVNNAGVMQLPERQETADGFEMQFGTNHLGHFASTGLLMDTLQSTPGARVVVVGSMVHRWGRIAFDNLNAEKSYSPLLAYWQSKLANQLFANELQRRFEAAEVDAIAVTAHPGWVSTELQRNSWIWRVLNPLFAQGAEAGALPTLYAAMAEGVSGGDCYAPDGFMQMKGTPVKVRASKRARDRALAEQLWAVSQALTGVHYPI